MTQKIEKYHHIMNFNFFFISYSVIYAKYNHCYEVSKEQPLRYFDGKEWKLMKPRHNIRTKAPRNSSISVNIDWTELIKEMKELELEETTTEMPKFSVSISDTTTATRKATTDRLIKKKLTTKRENTKKFTIRKENTEKLMTKSKNTKKISFKTAITKKITFKTANTKKITYKTGTTKKMTAKLTVSSKISVRRRASQSTTTVKPNVVYCRPVCRPKLKSAPTTTKDPRLLHLKMTTTGDWRDNWNLLRPTKKHSPVTVKKLALKGTMKFSLTTTRKPTTTTKIPVPTTRTSTTTTKKPTTVTKKPTAQTMGNVPENKKPLIAMEMPQKCAGNQVDEANSPANWSNLLKEFLNFVESKKCQRPPCETVTETKTKPYSGFQFAENADDLMSIMMDGVEIDERLDEEDEYATRIEDTLDYEGRRFNYESVENSVSRNSEIGNDYEQLLDFESLQDSIETKHDTTQFPKKMGHLTQYQAENSITSYIRQPDLYLDKLKYNNSIEDDDFLENDIKTHSDELVANLVEKVNLTTPIRGSEAHSGALKNKYTKKDKVVDDIEKKAYSDAFRDMHANKKYIFSGIQGSETLKISQNRKTKSYLDAFTVKDTTKDYYFSGIKESKMYLPLGEIKDEREKEVLQAIDTKFHSDAILGRIGGKDYATSRIRETEINSNELSAQEDKVIDEGELKFFINALKNKHAKKEKEPSEIIEKRKQYLFEENNGQPDKVNLQDESTDTFNSEELNEITGYIVSKPTHPIKLRSQWNNDDGFQDSDITFG